MQVSAFSQINRETVYLKNGSVVKGTVVGIVPNQSVTMTNENGDASVYNLTDVEKITRDRISVVDNDASESVYTNHEKGYKFILSFDFMAGEMSGLKWTTIHGVQLNNRIFLGLGVGLITSDDYDFHMSIPAFADFRFDFLENKITPFVEVRAGYDVALEGNSGFYGDFAFGCRFRRFSVSTGVETLRGEIYDAESLWNEVGCHYDYEICHNEYQALNFVVRFSFEF